MKNLLAASFFLVAVGCGKSVCIGPINSSNCPVDQTNNSDTSTCSPSVKLTASKSVVTDGETLTMTLVGTTQFALQLITPDQLGLGFPAYTGSVTSVPPFDGSPQEVGIAPAVDSSVRPKFTGTGIAILRVIDRPTGKYSDYAITVLPANALTFSNSLMETTKSVDVDFSPSYVGVVNPTFTYSQPTGGNIPGSSITANSDNVTAKYNTPASCGMDSFSVTTSAAGTILGTSVIAINVR